MSLSIVRDGDRVVVAIVGQLVISNREELMHLVIDELDGGQRRFLLDLRHTAYIDSAGLGALVSAAKTVRQQSGELRVANLNDARGRSYN
jgi:anti-sigma B factor antagonist